MHPLCSNRQGKEGRLNQRSISISTSQVEWFYFTNYIKHWSQPRFVDAMATIPQVTEFPPVRCSSSEFSLHCIFTTLVFFLSL